MFSPSKHILSDTQVEQIIHYLKKKEKKNKTNVSKYPVGCLSNLQNEFCH